MINQAIRSRGVGASEVAAVIGLDPRRDSFSIYARKLGLIDEGPSNARMNRGRYFQRGVSLWVQDITGNQVEWFDETVRHPQRDWQCCTPDAFILGTHRDRIGGLEVKTVAWDRRHEWGETGELADVPFYHQIQCQWSCSTCDLPWWDIAGLFGMDELRIYRVLRDPEVEAVLLRNVEDFWFNSVLKQVPPAIGRSEEAEAYIRKRFPRQVTPLREATEAEEALVSEFAKLKAQKKEIETAHEEAANALKVSIGDAEGFLSRLGKVTWKKDKDSVGPDWQAIARALSVYLTAAREIAESAYTVPEWLQHARTEETDKMMEAIRVLKIEDLVAQNQTVTRVGARKLLGPK